MRRRRLRLHCSSDEEEDQQPPPQQSSPRNETPTPSNPNPTHTPTPPPPLEISDDDFLDVPENFSPPRVPNQPSTAPATSHSPPPPPPPISVSNHHSTSHSPVDHHLRNLGLNIRREWLDSCISLLTASIPGFSRLDAAGKAELCFTEFLFSDMNTSGAGVLPENLHTLHLVDLPGPFVLQVDEIINIGCALKERYKHAPAGIKRCLKLSMTDGVQRVFGMEYRPIKNLEALAPAGLKVAIQNVHIRRGLLVLVPETLVVLGGLVEDLNAARQRLVQEINKPPRGRRTRSGSVPSLATRATQAAWPPNDVNDQPHANNSSSHLTSSFGRPGQGASFGFTGGDTRRTATVDVLNARSNAESNTSSNRVVNFEEANMNDASMPIYGEDRERVAETFAHPTVRPSATSGIVNADTRGRIMSDLFVPNARSNEEPNPSTSPVVDIEEISMIDASMPIHGDSGRTVAEAASDPTVRPRATVNTVSAGTRGMIPENVFVPNARSNAEPNALSNSFMDLEEADMSDASVLIDEDDQEVAADPSVRSNAEPDLSLDATSYVRDADMADEEEDLIPNSDEGSPFTYLASLIAKWTAKEDDVKPVVQGKIKCFLTGVKEFHFKGRTTYELHVYVDDGSLISEILIDHSVVQKGIGYSPKEVTAALSSQNSSVVTGMRETMKQFQFFLVNFEGIMLVEINNSSCPVALEMTQGCSSSDTWLLLRRLKTLNAPQTPRNQHPEPIDPIEISP